MLFLALDTTLNSAIEKQTVLLAALQQAGSIPTSSSFGLYYVHQWRNLTLNVRRFTSSHFNLLIILSYTDCTSVFLLLCRSLQYQNFVHVRIVSTLVWILLTRSY